MIVTALTMIDPVMARLAIDLPSIPFAYQVYTFGLVDIILMVLIYVERHQKRGRGVFPAILFLFLIVQSINLLWNGSALWDDFSFCFASFPLT